MSDAVQRRTAAGHPHPPHERAGRGEFLLDLDVSFAPVGLQRARSHRQVFTQSRNVGIRMAGCATHPHRAPAERGGRPNLNPTEPAPQSPA